MINGSIWTLSILSNAAALWAAISLLRRNLALKYPALTLMLVIAGVRGGILIFTGLVEHDAALYAVRWKMFQAIAPVIHGLVTVEVFVRLARHFKRFRWFGAALLVVLSLASLALTSCSTALSDRSWIVGAAVLMRTERYDSLCCLIFIALTVLFFSQFEVKFLPNVRRHVIILGWFFISLFLANSIVEVGRSQYWPSFAYQMLVLIGPLCCYSAWALLLTNNGELKTPTQNAIV